MRVRIHAAGVNRPDAMQRAGQYPPPPGVTMSWGWSFPVLFWKRGRCNPDLVRATASWRFVAGGAYSEAIVQADVCIPVPAGLSMVEAAGIPETYFTVWSNLFQRAGLQPGETVLLHGGTSGIGVTATLLAKAIRCAHDHHMRVRW